MLPITLGFKTKLIRRDRISENKTLPVRDVMELCKTLSLDVPLFYSIDNDNERLPVLESATDYWRESRLGLQSLKILRIRNDLVRCCGISPSDSATFCLANKMLSTLPVPGAKDYRYFWREIESLIQQSGGNIDNRPDVATLKDWALLSALPGLGDCSASTSCRDSNPFFDLVLTHHDGELTWSLIAKNSLGKLNFCIDV